MNHNVLSSTGRVVSEALNSLYHTEESSNVVPDEGNVNLTDSMEVIEIPPQRQHFASNNYQFGVGSSGQPDEQLHSQQSAASAQPYQNKVMSQGKRASDNDCDNRDLKRITTDSQPPAGSNLQNQYNVEIKNRFSWLNEEIPDDLSDENKIPPIFVTNFENQVSLANEIKSNVSSNFTTEFKNQKIRIQFQSVTDFRKAVKYFLATKKQFHTYSDKISKKYSIVIKNIHPSISESEILDEIKNKFNSAVKVTRLYKNNSPIPVVAVDFDGTHKIEDVLEIKQIGNNIVKPERRKKTKGPLQCYRCLDFGHSKNNCNHSISCVFCAGDHLSANCEQKNSTPTCKHCLGKHRADLRSVECPYYRKILESKRNNPNDRPRNNPNPPQFNTTNFPTLPPTNNIPNFSHATNFNHQQNTRNTNHQQHNNQQTNRNYNNFNIGNSFIQNITQFITNHIINFINSLIPTIIQNIQQSFAMTFSNNYGSP